jgi:hypothetical protein
MAGVDVIGESEAGRWVDEYETEIEDGFFREMKTGKIIIGTVIHAESVVFAKNEETGEWGSRTRGKRVAFVRYFTTRERDGKLVRFGPIRRMPESSFRKRYVAAPEVQP